MKNQTDGLRFHAKCVAVELVPDGLAGVAQREQLGVHAVHVGHERHDDGLAFDDAGPRSEHIDAALDCPKSSAYNDK
jgi:hypothetical protein